MAFVIAEPCIDVMDQACVRVCPVACIHGDAGKDRKLYIDPDECIDCGACVPVCPVKAIYTEILVPNLADRTVLVIDVPSRKVLATLPGGKDMTGVVVTADPKKAYVVRRGDHKVSVIDLERLQVTGEIAVGGSPEVATRTAGGKIYVANSGSGSVSVIDAGSDRVVTTIANVGTHPWALASFNGYNYCH
jgi:YVTN family beta-propeller protein